MGVDFPDVYVHEIDKIPTIYVGSVGPVGPVTVAGIPDHYEIDITNIPKIDLHIDPLEVDVTLQPIQVNPLDVSVRLKEIPSIRAHVPSHHCVGFSLLGVELAKIQICGEAQVITEPYRPNPCEICGVPHAGTVPLQPGHLTGAVDAVAEG
ncbi:MAG: hypothetical protein ACYTGZ_06285 [Planctomycetota bacterium]|jgi:hypothetical protein